MFSPNYTKFINVTPPVAIVDNAAALTTEIDTLGYDYCQIVVQYGVTDIATVALAVTESDTAGSGHANVTGLVSGTSTNIAGSTSALPTSTADNTLYLFEIDLRGRKRYLDTTITLGDGSSGTYVTALAILHRADDAPVTASQRGCLEILRV